MLNTPLISDLIFKGEVGRDQGDHEALARARHADLRPGAVRLYESHSVTFEDALRNADSVNDLRLQIKLHSQRARSSDLAAGTEHLTIVLKTYDLTPPRVVAFIGLGVMGHPMAGHLARAGHQRHRLQPHARKAAQWVAEYGGSERGRRRGGGRRRDVVFACVGNDDDLRSVTLGTRRRVRRHEAGRDRSSTTRPRRRRSRAS
jgi:hypothetical protein